MYSVIDIGSNTIRLVVYRLENGRIKAMLNQKYAAGLAAYVGADRRLSQDGIEKACVILREFRQIIDMLPDCEVFPFATASLRNIDNAPQVLKALQDASGLNVQILSGREEALYDYLGIIRQSQTNSGLLADIGGGSTEIVFYRQGAVQVAESIPIGSLTLYKRFVSGILPEEKEIRKMEKVIRHHLNGVFADHTPTPGQPLCSIGGTARGTLALYRSFETSSENTYEYDSRFISQLLSLLMDSPRKLTTRILKIAPERIHTLIPGLLILKELATAYQCPTILTSPYGVREGYLQHILEQRGILRV